MKTIMILVLMCTGALYMVSFINKSNSEFDEKTLLQLKLADDYARFNFGELKQKNETLKGKVFSPSHSVAIQMTASYSKVYNFIAKLREKLISETGGYSSNGGYVGANSISTVERIMIGDGSGNGYGYLLKKEVNQCIIDVNKSLSQTMWRQNSYDLIALDCGEDARLKATAFGQLDFVSFYFKGVLLIVALQELSILEFELARYQNHILNLIEQESDIIMDQAIAMVKPTSKIIDAGSRYEAEVFLGLRSSYITPRVVIKGKEVQLDPITKAAKYSFVAKADSFNSEGLSKQILNGSLTFKYKGKDTSFVFAEEYFVRDSSK